MKKFIFFLIILGIIVGVIIGSRSLLNTNQEDDVLEPVIADDDNINYEINLSISDIDTLNPLRTTNSHIADILKLVYEPLVVYDEENQIKPCLSAEWARKDEVTWIIKLKENVLWHGGEKFSSEDVKYTFDLLINGEINSVYSQDVQNIKAIDIVDDKTIVITLKEEEPYFPSHLVIPIVPKYYFKNDGIMDEEKAAHMVGTGPYMYDSSNESVIRLVANDSWHITNEIKLRKINLLKYSTYGEAVKGFKSSEIDMIFTNMHNWKEKFGFIGINAHSFESFEYEVLIPNTQNSILKDVNVRQAILQAINREDIVSNIYDGNATIKDMPITSNSIYSVASTEYNPDKAKQTLAKAGLEKKFSFTLIVPANDEDKIKCAEKIKQYLEEVSIGITIKKQSWSEYEKNIKSGKFELALASFEIKNEYQIQDLVSMSGEKNYARYQNYEMEQLMKELKNSADDVYKLNMRNFIEIYQEELPYIGLYFKDDIILTNKSVKGQYESTAYHPYRNLINFSK
ncbi:MAG: ABC transporter substrate-binding protein [Clostridia bacterium]|nr:ABC transporter substrate-binding protein [Clostridia bacterium]